MNLKKKIKGFFTLTRQANGGFTLVELIVVIAILAILAGVAVPVYSGYITKANQQADVSLAKEIENALTLGYYEKLIVPDDYVVVYPDADKFVEVEGAHTAEVMTAVFGDSYRSLRLKYGEWDNSVVDVIEAYKESSFDGNEEALLNDVQMLTDSFYNFVDVQDTGLNAFAGPNFVDFLKDNGIDDTNQQQVANSLTLYAAYRTKNIDETSFIDIWESSDPGNIIGRFSTLSVGEGAELGSAGGMAATYAKLEGAVRYVNARVEADNTIEDKTVTVDGTVYTNLAAWFSEQTVAGTTRLEVEDDLAALFNQTFNLMNTKFRPFAAAYLDRSEGESPAAKDAKAYLAALGAIDKSMPALLKEINSANMYNDGTVENFLNSYIKAGNTLSADGNAVMVMMQENGKAITIPLYNLGLMN